MSVVTKQAMRVYVALSNLGAQGDGDVLDALTPFFEPVLAQLNGALFNPTVFSAGIRHLYNWRFTSDVAREFIPRLARNGYLEKVANSSDYIVRYTPPVEKNLKPEAREAIAKILDQFEAFPAKVNDLLHFSRTREQLEDILIRFLVSLNAYTDDFFKLQVSLMDEEATLPSSLVDLEEGGRPLSDEERYICARFIKSMVSSQPEFVPYLTRLASIGLITDVVEDFIKPTSRADSSNLTIFLDAPMAQHYLGLSGKIIQADVASVLDSLKSIGCQIMMFPESCDEIARNLSSMLSLQYHQRYGYTHEAMRNGEVSEDYVRAVCHDPENAVQTVGIAIRNISINQYPSLQPHFPQETMEDFLSTITWAQDVVPREHDARCMAYVMRLREGRSSADLFNCRYVFATNNKTFSRKSRDYCIASKMIQARQWGPVVHLIDLATIAWLRTGLNQAEIIPRGRLVSVCERILQLRPEVTKAVYEKLSDVTPDRVKEFEFLLRDQRSARSLMDQTAGDQSHVTTGNVVHVLEQMRLATAAEVTEKLGREMQAQAEQFENERKRIEEIHAMERRKVAELREVEQRLHESRLAEQSRSTEEMAALARESAEEAAALKSQLETVEAGRLERLDGAIERNNRFVTAISRATFTVLVLLVLVTVANAAFSWVDWLARNPFVIGTTILVGVVSAYSLACGLMNKPILVIDIALNSLGATLLRNRLRSAVPEDWLEKKWRSIQFVNGLANRI